MFEFSQTDLRLKETLKIHETPQNGIFLWETWSIYVSNLRTFAKKHKNALRGKDAFSERFFKSSAGSNSLFSQMKSILFVLRMK